LNSAQQADLSLAAVRPFVRAFVTGCPPPMFRTVEFQEYSSGLTKKQYSYKKTCNHFPFQ